MQKNSFLYQVNVTRECNLRCSHCYISSDKKASSKFMTEQNILDVVKNICDHVCSTEKTKHAVIHFIGGEPTMLGLDFYQKVLPEIKEMLLHSGLNSKRIELSLVSNLLTPESVDIALLFDHVSTSYEIDTRFNKQKQKQMWINNVRLLNDKGKRPSVSCTITQQAIDLGAANCITELMEIGFKEIHFGFFIPSGDGRTNALTIFPRFECTSDFLIDVTNWFIQNKNRYPDVRISPIESLAEAIYYDQPSEDIICPIIPGSLDIDWNGDTRTCIESGGEIGASSLGNVFSTSIKDITSSPMYRRERSKAILATNPCNTCDELHLCQSGCKVLHGFWSGSGDCPGFKKYIKYVRKCVDEKALLPRREAGTA